MRDGSPHAVQTIQQFAVIVIFVPKIEDLQERSVRRQKFSNRCRRADACYLLGSCCRAGSGAHAPDSPRHRAAAACCSRMPSVKTSNPGMLRFCASSINPRRLRPSMSAAFWLRKEPPPNNLISRRCSDLVNSSQGIVGILMLPARQAQTSKHEEVGN